MSIINTQLKIKSLNLNSYKIYNYFLINLFQLLNIEYSIIQLPIRKKKFTLLKSPHVHKKAREQFEIVFYNTCFNLKQFDISLINLILLNKPSTIQIKIKNIKGV